MRLKQLKLSGFKSFARPTAFEFTSAATAIVGPNGSGKSNVAEAIRWVLGEQSMKALRGKRGEDFIFNGSTSSPRMGKAGVALTLDNRDRTLPLEFSEVVIERKIFRDGTNEYLLNGSPARLKDIAELLARLGLGSTQHNIISQGEVDRILVASPRERREILEEAIGLRLWQLKKREAERKLEETAKNITQVRALAQEIAPHLKFLKAQADKAEKREVLRRELDEYYRAYIAKEQVLFQAESDRIAAEGEPAQKNLALLDVKISGLQRDLEDPGGGGPGAEALGAGERELEIREAKRRELERELGRIEGRMESAAPASRRERKTVDIAAIEAAVAPILAELNSIAALADAGDMRGRIRAAAQSLALALAGLKQAGRPSAPAENLAGARSRLIAALKDLEGGLNELRKNLDRDRARLRTSEAALRERFAELREREEEAGALRLALERLAFERERLSARTEELERMIQESGLERPTAGADGSPFSTLEPEELKRKIERLRIRLEEIGGIDPAILKEYQDTKARHEFLERELEDLTKAEKDLRTLIGELEKKIEHDFREGFSKIQAEFHRYVRIIFDGGTGTLAYVPLRKAGAAEDGETEEAERSEWEEYGIEIDADLPRKRVRGLAMLSGGERALVSIALLFAASAVNPPPFLVLDETDSALDEANSRKYGAILKGLSEKTQLVLITHNRETMQCAGILYGVTMGGDGISKILSLKLEEAESYGNR